MTQSAAKTERLVQLLAERANRGMDALKLFRPTRQQEAAFRFTAKEISIRGGNRAGKSLIAFIMTAMVARHEPIFTHSGERMEPMHRVPVKDGKPIRPRVIWVVGYDQNHIGKTIHRMLFRAGAFTIIRDKHTQEWRAYQPWNPEDVERKTECKPAPPLIPPRLIDPKGWAWEDKANKEFKLCTLIDGTEIRAMSSKAEEWQGDNVDWIDVDEDIYRHEHYQEWRMRTAGCEGRLVWAYYPKGRNRAARELSNRAKQEAGKEKPDVQEVVLTFQANPFVIEDEKRALLAGMTENERRARDEGQFVVDDVQMYPNFSEYIHATPRIFAEDDKPIDTFLRSRGGEPGDDWTRYLVLDPGHTLSAVLFAAIPPNLNELGDHVVLFDELYLERHDADQLALKVREKMGHHAYQAFLIDDHAGRQTPMGYGKGQTVKQHYVAAFKRHGIASISTGNNFIAGCDNIDAGIGAVREWLRIRPNGTTKLKYVGKRMPHFKDEMEMYAKDRKSDGTILDDPAPRQQDHLMDALRYLAAYDPRYRKPPLVTVARSVDAMKSWWDGYFGKRANPMSFSAGPGSALTR